MQAALLVFVGGGVGAVLRYGTVLAFASMGISKSFPWAILAANGLGSLLLGALAAVPVLASRQHPLWFLLATGVLGGYTTFSTFSNDTWEMLLRGQVGAALLNAMGSVLLGLGAAALGWRLVTGCCCPPS